MTWADAVDVLQASQPFVYGLVAVATVVRWIRHRDRASGLASLLFLLLAGVILMGATGLDEDASLLVRQLTIAVLVLFPYLLFRFGAVFRPPGPVLEVLAAVLTLLAVSTPFLLSEIPVAGEEPGTRAFAAYTALVLVQWVGLSLLVAWWFWHAGRGRPTAVRRRLHTLAAGVLSLASALLLAGLFSGEGMVGAEFAVNALAVAAAPMFVAGLAPPRVLVDQWRRSDENELWQAEARLVAAGSPEEVAGALLPYVVRVVGGRSAILVDSGGAVIAVHGVESGEARELVAGERALRDDETMLSADLTSGRLLVIGDRFTPFFGREEVATVARLGRLTDVALRRAAADAAEQRATEELRRTNAAIRDFVAAASHDLRTPIAVIKGFAATLTGTWSQLPDDAKLKHLATIDRQAGHLARIVTDLLTVSQLDSGAVEPDLVDVDLVELVGEVVEELEHDDQVRVDLQADGAPLARVDAEHARRIIRNLLENAVRYGEPPITVALSHAAPWVELRVRDHGPGVPAEFRSQLFERFTRSDKAASRAKQGTGLGLSIVRGLARTGGGDAWYEAVEPGACFAVRFPAAGETAG